MGRCTHAGLRPFSQQLCHSIDQWRIDQGFIALNIDHHRIGCKSQQLAGFSQTITPTGVVLACQQSADAVHFAGLDNAFIVGGHHHLAGMGLKGALCHPNHHRQPTNVGQRLIGQTAGSHAGRDDHGKSRL